MFQRAQIRLHQIAVFSIFAVFVASCGGSNSGSSGGTSSTTTSSQLSSGTGGTNVTTGTAALTISPSGVQSVGANGTLQFSATGGTAPYSFHVTSGGGSIDLNSGLYTAPATGAATIGVKDAAGAWSYAGVQVTAVGTVLNVSATLTSLVQGASTQLSITGGYPPYRYFILGGGSIDSSTGVYTAPMSETTVQIQVIDSVLNSATLNLNVIATNTQTGGSNGGDTSSLPSIVELQTSFGILKAFHGNCDSSQPISGPCNAAVHRFCVSQGYPAGGFGPVEHYYGSATVDCIKEGGATYFTTDIGTLQAFHSGCSQSNPMSSMCNAAIRRFCQARGFPAGGYGPNENDGQNFVVSCVFSSVGTEIAGYFSDLQAYHGSCTGGSFAANPVCSAAVRRSCVARGYVSGFGISEWNGSSAIYTCVK